MKQKLNKKTRIALVVVVMTLVVTLVFSMSRSNALALDEAREIAMNHVPSTAVYVTSEEENNKFEIMFYDESLKTGYEIEVLKDDKKVKKVETRLDDYHGSQTVELTEQEVEKIIKEKFNGITSITIHLDLDNGLYEYEVDFKGNDFYGEADVHPISGAILDSTIKYGTAVTIPMNQTQESETEIKNNFISYQEAQEIALKEAGGGIVKDIELEKEKNHYYYEIELVKDKIEYDYNVDAMTGDISLEDKHDSYFEYDDQDEQNQTNQDSNDLLSSDKIKEIVLGKIPGANIQELKLEKDNGIYVYEGEAFKDGYEYEFEINASTGVIIDWEKEIVEADD